MRVTEVDSFGVSIPLDEPVSWSTGSVDARDHAIVRIRTDAGYEGLGYTLGYGAATIMADVIDAILAPIVVGEDPRDVRRIWNDLFDRSLQIGRNGIMMRAISMIDIALWDLIAKDAKQPLHKHLGAVTNRVPTYASGGYYRDSSGTEALRNELSTYVDRGHDIVKIKVGGRSVSTDVDRVAAARETIGPDRTLLLDANCRWRTEQEAVAALRAFAPYEPYFIEEPVRPDSIGLMARINDAIDYHVAAGEIHETRYRFEQLIRTGAIDIVQADATVVGGITEWLSVAHHASSVDVPLAPHYNWDLHAPLLASVTNGLWLEYFYEDMGVKAFDAVLNYPLAPDDDGYIELPDRAGHGVVLDEDRVDELRIE